MEQLVEAGDSDLAIWKAEAQCKEVVSEEDRGPLISLALLNDDGTPDLVMLAGTYEEPEEKTKALPKRRARGMTLSYSDGDLTVIRFGYSASLTCAANEGVLHPSNCMKEEMELSAADMKIVHEWADMEDAYYAKHGWKTWAEIYEPA